jgi:hypothetical protein
MSLFILHKVRKIFLRPTRTFTIKLFTAIIYGFLLKARVFVPGTPFQPNLMFAGKAGAKPRKATFIYSTQRSYPQTLDLAGKACHVQTLKLIMKIRKLWP